MEDKERAAAIEGILRLLNLMSNEQLRSLYIVALYML